MMMKRWSKWARLGVLMGAGVSSGCGGVDPAPVSQVPTPVPPGEESPTTPPASPTQPPTEGPPSTPEPTPPPVAEPEAPPASGSTRRDWLLASFFAGVSPKGIAVGDFNHDGAPDLAINAEGRNHASPYVNRTGEFLLLRNDGRGGLGTVAQRWPLPHASGGRLAVGDA